MTDERDRIAIPILCVKCGQAGSVTTAITGDRRNVVQVSNGFHLGEAKGPSGDPDIICDRCEGKVN